METITQFKTRPIVGLAIGVAACFLIMQYVLFELSYDKFHENGDRIYRVILRTNQVTNASNHPGVGPALEADFPEVEEYARAVHQSIFMGDVAAWSHVDAKGNEMVFNEEHVYNVDPSFLTMFSFPFVFGDPGNALSDVSSVVISQTIFKKFFGSENPLGKTLLLNGHRPFTITGVFEDVPENSHIKFDILVSYFLRNGWGDGWNPEWDWKWPEYYTYVRLVPQTGPQELEAKFPEFVSKYMGDIMEEFNIENHFHLQALADIHLKSPNLKKEREAHGSERTVYFLMLIAILILVIAWINYINMSTSKSIERAREVGFRKVVGASRQQLIFQFLFESALVNLLAIALSFVLIVVALPYFNQLTGKNISTGILDLILLKEPWFWFMLAGTFVFGSFFAGLYPAFILSSFRVASVLKGKFFRSRSGIALRKTLVGSQFVISVALIAGTVMVFKQVSLMRLLLSSLRCAFVFLIFFACNPFKDCNKVKIDQNQLAWLDSFKTRKNLIYKSDLGKIKKFKIEKKPEYYTECLKLSRGANIYQFLGYRMIPMSGSTKEDSIFSIDLHEYISTEDFDYSYKGITIFGYDVSFSDETNPKLRLDTLSLNETLLVVSYFFERGDGLNPQSPKGDYTKNFHWSKKYGLVRFETLKGEVFELVMD